MAKHSILLDSGNVNVKEENDREESMSLQTQPTMVLPPSSSQPQQSLIDVCVKEEPDVFAHVQLSMPLLPSILVQKNNDNGAKLMESVNELINLSAAIQTFKGSFDELQMHLDLIEKAIDTRSRELTRPTNTAPNAVTMSSPLALGANVQNAAPGNPQYPTGKNKILDSNSKLKPKMEIGDAGGSKNELLSLCQMMSSRELRKYIVARLPDPVKLREEVPVALKSAPKPSRLVFECIGRFFLQGKRAYNKNSPMIPARQASVLVLEFYLLSGCIGNESKVEASLKGEARLAAVAWRKRLIAEGGLSQACETDARGLLLFVACFGIPAIFRNDDIRVLVRLSNPIEIGHALRQSPVLLTRISDIIEGMMKKGPGVEAADLTYIFGFEEKFSPQAILTQFLLKSEEKWKQTKMEACGSAIVVKEASEKYLAALKSVANCLAYHKIDPIKLLPGWQLKEKMINLEKDIADAIKKIGDKAVAKRKMDKNDSSSKLKIPESKRSKFTGRDSSSLISPSVTALHEQRIVTHMDINSSYDVSLAAHLLDGRLSVHSGYYPTATSVTLGSVGGPLPESVLRGTIASGGDMLGGAVAGAGISAGFGSTANDSYPGFYGDDLRDQAGTAINSNGQMYRWPSIGEVASIGQIPVAQPASSWISVLHGLPPSAEGFAGVPDHPSISVSKRSGGSDLYGFADAL